MKTFKEFINESLRDKMVGKSDEEILKSLEKLSDSDKIIAIIKYQLPYELLPDRDPSGNLIVIGNLECSHNYLTRLLDNLVVNGRLDYSYNRLTKLPDNLIVEGGLWCANNKGMLKKPKDAKICGIFMN